MVDTTDTTKVNADRIKRSIESAGDSLEQHIKKNLSVTMLDLTVLAGLEEYVQARDATPTNPDLKQRLFTLRGKRAVNPTGIVHNGSSVKILFGGGGGQEFEEREVSPYNPAEVPFGSYIVQQKPHRIEQPTPYDHQDDGYDSDASSVVYWMGDSEQSSQQTYLD